MRICRNYFIPIIASLLETGALGSSNDKLRLYRGFYNNPNYGYSVVIPDGLTGIDDSGDEYQRGFSIKLKHYNSKIYVYAEVNSLEFRNPCQNVKNTSLYVNQSKRHFFNNYKHTEAGKSILYCEALFKYTQKTKRMADIVVTIISKNNRYIYNIIWKGPLKSLGRGKSVVGKIKASWKLIPKEFE